MADYFSEYSTFVGGNRLPSPADTPYETPNFIRSKRSPRATASSSREQSTSPLALLPSSTEFQDGAKDGKFTGLDPRRFTPTLHASLVSEILSLRRELDSKNNLVENLETSLSTARAENDTLNERIAQNAKDVRKAKQQVQQMEKGTYEVVENLAKERDLAMQKAEDLSIKLDDEKRKTRRQDEDSVRTQSIWENEKEQWENERRQLERRIHVTENRLRGFVEEMTAQQLAGMDAQADAGGEVGYEGTFNDSGIGHESDTASIRSASPRKHRRNVSSVSTIHRETNALNIRFSASTRGSVIGTPEPGARPNGHSLADELGIDEEDELDIDEFETRDEDLAYQSPRRRTAEIGLGVNSGDEPEVQRALGLTQDVPGFHRQDSIQAFHDAPSKQSLDSSTAAATEPSRDSLVEPPIAPSVVTESPRAQYVDTGYQPSPPPSPRSKGTSTEPFLIPSIIEPSAIEYDDGRPSPTAQRQAQEVAMRVSTSPVSPPETPVVGRVTWPEHNSVVIPKLSYSDAEAQTDFVEAERTEPSHTPKRDSLSPPSFVPSIAIHPPTSRPSSPRPYVLPPGTKNASAQASMSWPGRDASVQTEEIRVDTRLRRLPPHLQPSSLESHQQRDLPGSAADASASVVSPQPPRHNFSHPLLPSPTLPEPSTSRRVANGRNAKIFTSIPPVPALPPPSLYSPVDSSPHMSQPRKYSGKAPLRAINLPKPVLAPVHGCTDSNGGPLNRSSQYGVTRPLQSFSQLLDIDRESDGSEYDDPVSDIEHKDLTASVPSITKAPQGRFGLSEPPKMVPEDKEISPDRGRPETSGSQAAAPAPSVASSKTNSQRAKGRPPAKLGSYRDNVRSRSPSFGSMASSSYSTEPTALPPFPIPRRSSSRYPAKTFSEGSQSPTTHMSSDVFGRSSRSSRAQSSRDSNLRKVQSATAIRHTRARTSPPKARRQRPSPNLTPAQSVALEPATQTKFPIPEMPTPLHEHNNFDLVKGSMDIGGSPRPYTAATSEPRSSTETSLVDAIAATMVGEWMWKYIRKRKSFGIGEDTSEVQAETGTVSINAHGTRHKRWVWLSPYERTIMWDNKQPTSGPALLGKKGRKLSIRSVIDVQDNTPMPKGAELGGAFNRSILILTPQRALKFTAINQDRHMMWMTALEFLAQAGRLPAQLPQAPSRDPPPIPIIERPAAKRSRSPSFGRATIRDSVRLAKGRRPSYHRRNERQSAGGGLADSHEIGLQQDTGADFPAVPRLYISTVRHQRKRSNTAPRLPPPLSNFRSFSSSAVTSSNSSRLHPASNASVMTDPRSSTSNKSWSRTGSGSIASPDRPNFFEAFGTVRMEAFVDPNIRDGVLYLPAPPPKSHSGVSRRGRGEGKFSISTADKRRAGYVFDDNGVDPFQGF
ncbi:anucleate primary sterigmata protein A-like [Teratosphaeria destructans]|uniref:Anucleate primary sterigmata protein A-like n=1 Tax=Teratosphaeria destructans TaxID=418781 RepID=A0A9W7SXY1_9PEZI|nr:anucleate primary sterigmata protein A-like [Teratosphaeria destructans]